MRVKQLLRDIHPCLKEHHRTTTGHSSEEVFLVASIPARTEQE